MQVSNIDKARITGNYLNLYLGQNQGVRLGESTVVSRKVHAKMPEKRIKGQIKILTNCDAGKTYLDYIEADRIVHIDVYYKKGEVNPKDLARGIFWAIEKYVVDENPQLEYAENERFKIVSDYTNRIYIACNQGKGVVYDIIRDEVKPLVIQEEGHDHIHILARLSREEYKLIYIITEGAEEVLIKSGFELAHVRSISHGKKKQEEENFAGYMKLPWTKLKGQNASILPDKENVNQLVLKLAEKFGGVTEIEEFMESYSSNIFKRRGIDQQKKKYGDVEHYVDQLEELDLIKKTLLGKRLNKRGKKLKEYIIKHQCELETEIRRNIRKVPGGGNTKFRKLGKADYKTSHLEYINRNKTINDSDMNWSGDIAVPETIIQARKNSFFRGDKQLTLNKEDFHYYSKKTYVPIDICLLMDASGSMAGEKRQAACYLVEHLLLTGKEKVAVVSFQERSSQIVVPFTRNQSILRKGLACVNPAGLTPMADGIVTACGIMKPRQVRNPLLIMITDGEPNTPLWTMDAKADALKAATQIHEEKIRFICIGVESNRIFMEKLCKRAAGVLYLVDDLNKENLINIVKHEKKIMVSS